MAQQQTFKRTELHSGVRVLSERMSEVKSISLGVWIDSGSRDESLDEQGLSHFLEHMLFKGTPRLSALEIAEAFDCIGADINAATGREHTSIYSRMLQEHLPRAIEIVMEMAQHSVLDPEELNSERQVVLEEINMHNDSPDELVHDHLGFAMWGENPIGHSVLGDSDVIKTVDAKFFREFYRRNYVGSRVVVTACGAVDHEHLCDMVEEHMRDLAPGAPQNRSLAMDTPLTSVRIVEKETEQAHIAIGGKGLPKRHPDRFALLIVDNLLGGSMSSRLFQRIREQLGLVYSIYSYSALFIGIGMVGIYAGTHPSQAARVISLIEEELAKARVEGFTSDEIERAKNHIRGSLYISNENSVHRMNRLTSSELAGGERLDIEEIVSRVEKVTMDDLRTVFDETWGATPLSLAVIGPFEQGALSLAGITREM